MLEYQNSPFSWQHYTWFWTSYDNMMLCKLRPWAVPWPDQCQTMCTCTPAQHAKKLILYMNGLAEMFFLIEVFAHNGMDVAFRLEASFNGSLRFWVCLFALHSKRRQSFYVWKDQNIEKRYFGLQLSREKWVEGAMLEKTKRVKEIPDTMSTHSLPILMDVNWEWPSKVTRNWGCFPK